MKPRSFKAFVLAGAEGHACFTGCVLGGRCFATALASDFGAKNSSLYSSLFPSKPDHTFVNTMALIGGIIIFTSAMVSIGGNIRLIPLTGVRATLFVLVLSLPKTFFWASQTTPRNTAPAWLTYGARMPLCSAMALANYLIF